MSDGSTASLQYQLLRHNHHLDAAVGNITVNASGLVTG